MTAVYLLVVWTALVGFVAFGVDLARLQVAKTKLYVAADAAARYGVTGLQDGTTVAKAISAAQNNYADGTPVILQSSDIEIGTWNSSTRTFTPTNISPNSVRVTARRSAARGNAISTTFASLLGWSSTDAKAVAVVTIIQSTSVVNNVTGFSNPWLAGMPAGTTANWYDSAPAQSPTPFQGVVITPGATLNISFSGSISNGPSYQPYGPDGDAGWILDNNWATANGGSEHGIANIKAPICSMIGVFLDDNQPDSSPAPPPLDLAGVEKILAHKFADAAEVVDALDRGELKHRGTTDPHDDLTVLVFGFR